MRRNRDIEVESPWQIETAGMSVQSSMYCAKVNVASVSLLFDHFLEVLRV